MIRYIPISSGSKGNATYIDFDGKCGTLLDCGIQHQLVRKALYNNNVENNVSNILISHAHNDHNEFEDSYRMMFSANGEKINIIHQSSLPHGDTTSEGMLLEYNGQSVLWMTDFHEVPTDFLTKLKEYGKIDLVLIEANYDLELVQSRLTEGSISEIQMVQRCSRHYSTFKTLKFLSEIEFTKVHFLHLSESNNTEELLTKRIVEFGADYEYTIGNNNISQDFQYVNKNEVLAMALSFRL